MAANIKAYISLGKFLGEENEDVERYFRKIERWHRQVGYGKQEKASMIPFGLDGKSLDFYEGTSAETQGNYNEIKNAIIAHFKPNRSVNRLWEELCQIKKLPHQSVNEFYSEIRKKANKISGVTDQNILRIFMTGLGNPLKNKVAEYEPATIGDALNKARLIESIGANDEEEALVATSPGKQKTLQSVDLGPSMATEQGGLGEVYEQLMKNAEKMTMNRLLIKMLLI